MNPQAGTEQLSRQVALRDGRQLGFAEYGSPGGQPVFYFHGWPSSRLEARLARDISAEMGLRLIAPDRPGYGLSDHKSNRTILEWADDVRQLADHLAIERFAVLGISGGGPYAAACAAAIPDRLNLALLVCSLAPMDAPGAADEMVPLNRWLLSLARNAPWLAQKLATTLLRVIWGTGDQVIPEQVENHLPELDRRTLASPGLRAALIASSREGLRPGVEGAASEGLLFSRPWGFRLDDIRVPVRLWHGERDNIVPSIMGHYLAKAIPNCRAKFYPDDGHFSLPFGHIREILAEICPDSS